MNDDMDRRQTDPAEEIDEEILTLLSTQQKRKSPSYMLLPSAVFRRQDLGAVLLIRSKGSGFHTVVAAAQRIDHKWMIGPCWNLPGPEDVLERPSTLPGGAAVARFWGTLGAHTQSLRGIAVVGGQADARTKSIRVRGAYDAVECEVSHNGLFIVALDSESEDRLTIEAFDRFDNPIGDFQIYISRHDLPQPAARESFNVTTPDVSAPATLG